MTITPISKPIRSGVMPDWDDLNRTRDAFRDLGFYGSDQDGPMLDNDLVKGIKGFQKARGLIVDGIINPGGETENELFKVKAGRPLSSPVVASLDKVDNEKIGFGGPERGVASNKNPHNAAFGLVEKPKKNKKDKLIDTPLRKQSPEKTNRDLFKLSNKQAENWQKNKNDLFTIQPPTDRPVNKTVIEEILKFDSTRNDGDLSNVYDFGLEPRSIMRDANKKAEEKFKYKRGVDDEADAYRHALGAYLLTQKYGAKNAKLILDRHERRPGFTLNSKDLDGKDLQDLYNNKIGIDAALDPKNKDRDPAELIMELYMKNKLQERPFRLDKKRK